METKNRNLAIVHKGDEGARPFVREIEGSYIWLPRDTACDDGGGESRLTRSRVAALSRLELQRR